MSYKNVVRKKKKGQKIAAAATAFAIQLSECYSDKELCRIKIFLTQVVNTISTIQGHDATTDDFDD
ncbi:MAG: hypothetical protein WCR30_03700 [Clostridia bacterium]